MIISIQTVDIKTRQNTRLVFDVDPNDTVEHVKGLVQDLEGIPPDQQRLIYAGRQLENGRTLDKYRIENGAEVHLVLRLRGQGHAFAPDYLFLRLPESKSITDRFGEHQEGSRPLVPPVEGKNYDLVLVVKARYGHSDPKLEVQEVTLDVRHSTSADTLAFVTTVLCDELGAKGLHEQATLKIEQGNTMTTIRTNEELAAITRNPQPVFVVEFIKDDDATFDLNSSFSDQEPTIDDSSSLTKIIHGRLWGKPVAVKVFEENNISSQALRDSIETLRKYQHPNVVKSIAVSKRSQEPALAVELCHIGSLSRILHTRKISIPFILKLKILADVARGLHYLHNDADPSCIHRNLWSDAVYLTYIGGVVVAKVGDYGLEGAKESHSKVAVNSAAYRAPELLRSPNVSPKVDVYSFGLLLWEVMAEKIPYEDEQKTFEGDDFRLMMHVIDGNRPDISEEDCPLPGIAALIRSCWSTDPDERPDMVAVLAALEEMLASETGHGFLPDGFICPLTLNIMKDPVMTPMGLTYERSAIVKHLQGNTFDPITWMPLEERQLIPNKSTKSIIEQFALSKKNDDESLS